MNFEKDIFISYAHIDDESLIEGEKGWITEFHRALEVRLSQLLGERPNIWRDSALDGNHNFNDEIISQFPKIALLISIITPRYVKSEWCVKEVIEFKKASDQNIGIEINNKSRIFKVVKTPVKLEQHPEDVQGLLGYDFFMVDEDTNRVKEFSKVFGAENQQLYWSKLDDVAHDIATLLEEMKEESGSSAQPKEEGIKIYLAESSFDQKEERDSIKRWLMENNYKVLPDQNLPLVIDEYTEQVTAMMSECELSIHMVGTTYGLVPEGTEDSKSVIQNHIGAKLSENKGLKRIIWSPPEVIGADDRQNTFLENIKINPDFQIGADYLITPLEDLKFSIQDKMVKKEEKEEKISETPSDQDIGDDLPSQIYLICDETDLDNIIPLEDYFFDQGFDVILPAFDGEQSELREDHQENLKNCDAVIIYFGAGNDLWVRTKVRDLMKISGYGRTKPLDNKAIILAAPDTRSKARYRAQDMDVVNLILGFDEALLTDLTTKIKSSKI
ncbi:toll/interleukin-1 receptor domain-containing protein [Vicingaceae bacterium]|nr:toll/interleukin-1 receptor domain-containing protein [Vicingaceae bacterium]